MADDVLKALKKKYGVSVVHLSGESSPVDVDSIPTGLLPLDIATGVGGIPRGCFVEVFAADGVGKSTLSTQVAKSAQAMGLGVAYIDMEHRFDPKYAMQLGVDLSTMYFTQPPYAEAAMNVAENLIDMDLVQLVIVDSVASLVPKAEIDGEIGDQFVGLQARIVAQSLRKMAPLVKAKNATVLFTNQLRDKIGGMGSLAFGPQSITPGGRALKFYASMRLELKRIKTLKNGDVPYGHVVRITVVKSSVGIPLRSVDLTLRYGVGFDRIESVIDLALKHGIVIQKGAWYYIGNDSYHGRETLYSTLGGNPTLFKEVSDRVATVFTP